jgi:hypothetical protein
MLIARRLRRPRIGLLLGGLVLVAAVKQVCRALGGR